MLKGAWSYISSYGGLNAASNSEDKRLRLTSQFLFLSFAFTIVIALFCAFGSLIHAFCLEAVFSFFYLGLFFFFRHGWANLSRYLFIILINVQAFVLCLCLGRESQVHLVYIAVAAVPLILFDIRSLTKILLFTCLTFSLFATLFIIDFDSPFSDVITPTTKPYLEVFCIGLSIICEIVTVYSIIASSDKVKQKLDDSNSFLQSQVKAIFDNSQDGLFLVDSSNKRIIKANKRAVEIFEMDSEHQFYSLYGNDLHKEKWSEDKVNFFYNELRSNKSYEDEILYKTNKGNEFWGALAIKLISINGKEYQSVRVTNIHSQKKSQRVTQAALQEKEVLLAEIHHRVKNNMAVISGLLGVSSNYVEDEKAKLIFEESRNRIHTMALIHEKLYSYETLSKIEFKTYIHDLIKHLENSYSRNATKISFSVLCTDVFLDIKNAVPCGLILNELITNAYKHAFTGRTEGEINVVCTHSDKTFTMRVQDNGIGFDTSKILDKPKTLGLTLINALTEQLEGVVEAACEQGTLYSISFNI